MSNERLKNGVEAAYKIVLLGGVLVAAGFDAFVARKPELARQELNTARQVLADVDLKSQRFVKAGRCFLLLTASVHNKGVREARLRLDAVPWRLALVTPPGTYEPLTKTPARTFTKTGNNVVALTVTELVPNETATYEALVEVPASTIVFAEFSIPVAESLIRVEATSNQTHPAWRWSARGHFPTCGVKII